MLGFSDLQADIAAELIRAGIEVHVFNHRSVAEILRMIATLGGMVGCADEGRRHWSSELAAGLDAIRASAARFARRPRVYFEEWDEPQISGIRWVSELIGIAGGEDCFPELARESLGKNRIIADPLEVPRRAPEVIFGSWCGKKFRPEHRGGAAGLGRGARGARRASLRDQVIDHPAAGTGGADRRRARNCTRAWSGQCGHRSVARWLSPVDPTSAVSRQASRYLALVFAMISGGSFGAGRLLVPVERLEVVAHELLVEGGRADALAVGVGGPEARGVRRQHLVDQHQLTVGVPARIRTWCRR